MNTPLRNTNPLNTPSAAIRYLPLDAVRGFLVVEMVVFHFLYDLVYLYGWNIPWFTGTPGQWWERTIAGGFILLSGVVAPLSRRPWRRTAGLALAAFIVTATTVFFMPDQLIWFGILHFLAAASAMHALAGRWFAKWPVAAAAPFLFVFLILFSLPVGHVGFGPLQWQLPGAWYQSVLLAPLGFPPPFFQSADYFPLLPWLFLYLAGVILSPWALAKLPRKPVGAFWLRWVGRNALAIYLLHQPVILAAAYLFVKLISEL